MTAIKTTFGTGGANLTPNKSAGEPDLATTLREVADDFTELRTQFVALLAKLDGDAGVALTNYAATLTPATQKTTKA